MLFGSRNPRSLSHHLRQLLWPRSGWRRALSYLAHRTLRLKGTPYSIAAGFACGAAMSMTPFIGFHFVLSGLLAWLVGANLLASAIGTAVGNPWTFPFIWMWTHRIGAWILGLDAHSEPHTEVAFSYLMDNLYRLLVPMMVGSLPTAIVVWGVVYWPLRYLVAGYQGARQTRRRARRRKLEGSTP